jgi:hypothetical protein
MFYVKYEHGDDSCITPSAYADLEGAEIAASAMRTLGRRNVEVLVDLTTADETARAMSFQGVVPVLGRAVDNPWAAPADAR